MKNLNKFVFSQDPKTVIDLAIEYSLKTEYGYYPTKTNFIVIFPIEDEVLIDYLSEIYNVKYYVDCKPTKDYDTIDPCPTMFCVIQLKDVFGDKLTDESCWKFQFYLEQTYGIKCYNRNEKEVKLYGRLSHYKD